MSAAHELRLTPAEYLEIERHAAYRSEYYAGEMFAMAGASESHVLLSTNVATQLNLALRDGPCRVYANDMRVKVAESGLYTYPDVVVACEPRQFLDEHRDTLLTPTLIVEVLSPSTEAYDRGQKFALYRSLACLREYVLVSQTQPRIERFDRQPATTSWLLSEAIGLDTVMDLTVDCRLRLCDVYRNAAFPPEQPSETDRVRDAPAPICTAPRRFPGTAG